MHSSAIAIASLANVSLPKSAYLSDKEVALDFDFLPCSFSKGMSQVVLSSNPTRIFNRMMRRTASSMRAIDTRPSSTN